MARHHLLLASFLLAGACGSEPSRLAADFTLPDMKGAPVTLSSFRGKTVLLNFWATWCDSCREETPALEELRARLGPKGLVLLGVSLDEDAAKAVPPFLKEFKATYPVLVADRKAVADYAVRGLPTTFLVDRDGRVVRRWVGPLDLRAVENDILAQLDRRPP